MKTKDRFASWTLFIALGGCGGSGSGSSPSPPAPPAVAAPVISVQPTNQSVPMGLPATYAVTATGSALHYQWTKNGAAIAGATQSSYSTPATTFADTGASFVVTVSNSGGKVSSAAASLAVTARAPMAGDLRFEQVDAASTVNGWGSAAGLSTNIPGRGAFYYGPDVGTPLYVGSGGDCAIPPVQNGVGCGWSYSVYPIAAPTGNSQLFAAYAGDFYNNFASDLSSATSELLSFPNGVAALASSSVITSLDLEPASNLFALSWMQSAPQNDFLLTQNTVTPAQLQAAVDQEGAAGRVITAISNNAGSVTYFSYAWQADTATLYEGQAVTASTDGTPGAAAALAQHGYVITAIGQADATGDIYLIGTRVQGDTVARPFMIVQGDQAFQTAQQQGYAVVGVVVNLAQQDPYYYLFER